ncbi:MAG: hypothetical protein MJH09_00830 [Cetobacterium sp.]|nr:hypothetical protein [Cetobacterium sp.]
MDIKNLEDLKKSMDNSRKKVKCTSHKVNLSKDNLILFWQAQIEKCDIRLQELIHHMTSLKEISHKCQNTYKHLKEEKKYCEQRLKEIKEIK